MYYLGQRIREVPWNIRNANSRIDGNIFWAGQIRASTQGNCMASTETAKTWTR